MSFINVSEDNFVVQENGISQNLELDDDEDKRRVMQRSSSIKVLVLRASSSPMMFLKVLDWIQKKYLPPYRDQKTPIFQDFDG